VLGTDLDQCRLPVKEHLALYIGGMGPRERNFYNRYAIRMGYEAEARKIQDLYLSGRKVEAVAAVPDRLVDEIALVGPADRIRDRLQAWKEAAGKGHIASLLAGGASVDALRLLAEELL
jgi:alkanesulfonate monooxygenase SsuD/methylene tetrahydromethanopterin reductase-like flavin-dependent oxidoreductase (luciferase family)